MTDIEGKELKAGDRVLFCEEGTKVWMIGVLVDNERGMEVRIYSPFRGDYYTVPVEGKKFLQMN